jgi:hypothetical protein
MVLNKLKKEKKKLPPFGAASKKFSTMNFYNAMTNRQNFSSVQYSSPVDGLLMDRLSVIARNRGMGGRRLGPHTTCMNKTATFMPNSYDIKQNVIYVKENQHDNSERSEAHGNEGSVYASPTLGLIAKKRRAFSLI